MEQESSVVKSLSNALSNTYFLRVHIKYLLND